MRVLGRSRPPMPVMPRRPTSSVCAIEARNAIGKNPQAARAPRRLRAGADARLWAVRGPFAPLTADLIQVACAMTR